MKQMAQRRRKRPLPRWPVCKFLLLLVLLPQFGAEREADGDNPDASDTIALPRAGPGDTDPYGVPVWREENGVLVLTKGQDIPPMLQSLGTPLLLVGLSYNKNTFPTCSDDQTNGEEALMNTLKQVAERIDQYMESLQQDPLLLSPPPRVAKLDVSSENEEEKEDASSWLRQAMSVMQPTSHPRLLWCVPNPDDPQDAVIVQVLGPQSTAEQLFRLLLHAWYRSIRGPVWQIETLDDLDRVLQVHADGLLQHVAPAIHPDYTMEEQQTIEWIMNHDKQKEEEDPFVVFVQCQQGGTGDALAATEDAVRFAELADVMGSRRDVAFFALTGDCGDDDDNDEHWVNGTTVAILVVSSSSSKDKKWQQTPIAIFNHTTTKTTTTNHLDLQQFLERYSTPSVLWFDRTSVAPIAFPEYRKIHASLFVPLSQNEMARRAVRQFRRACRAERWNARDVVCLVVPHTEKRILTTFGIDPWSPLDAKALHTETDMLNDQVTEAAPVLPALLLTDQRYNGTRKYYLDALTMDNSSPSAISDFFQNFWDGRLQPYTRSSSVPLHRNKNHVQIVTANTFRQAILQDEAKHSLLFLYTPTCGHCKRFSIVWNKLARLVQYLGWDSFLNIAKLDVTENEIISKGLHIDVHMVPDVYYFPKGEAKQNAIRYDVVDDFGDGAGRLSDPIDIIEWLVNVSNDPELTEQELLLRLENGKEEEKIHTEFDDDEEEHKRKDAEMAAES